MEEGHLQGSTGRVILWEAASKPSNEGFDGSFFNTLKQLMSYSFTLSDLVDQICCIGSSKRS